MITERNDVAAFQRGTKVIAVEPRCETWVTWPVSWSAIWTGALAAFAGVLIFGLVGIAVGTHLLGAEHRVVDLKKIGMGALIFSVCAAFFAFVAGGWIAGRIAGTRS